MRDSDFKGQRWISVEDLLNGTVDVRGTIKLGKHVTLYVVYDLGVVSLVRHEHGSGKLSVSRMFASGWRALADALASCEAARQNELEGYGAQIAEELAAMAADAGEDRALDPAE